LWVNKNKIANLSLFIEKVALSCPNLRFLSMLNNEACPNYFNKGTLKQYQDYRQFVISRLKNIKTLDSEEIASQEVNKASEVYGVLPIRAEKDVLNKIPIPTNLEKKSKSEKKIKKKRTANVKPKNENIENNSPPQTEKLNLVSPDSNAQQLLANNLVQSLKISNNEEEKLSKQKLVLPQIATTKNSPNEIDRTLPPPPASLRNDSPPESEEEWDDEDEETKQEKGWE